MNIPMRTVLASALLAGSVAMLAPTANAQNLAAEAARAKKASIIRIVGRPDLAEAVKATLVLQGVLPTSIALVGRDDTSSIVRASSGTAEPVNRSVLIAF